MAAFEPASSPVDMMEFRLPSFDAQLYITLCFLARELTAILFTLD